MSFTVLCSFVLAFYVAIWFFDYFFKSCMHYPYFAFLEGTGLKVGTLNFSWTTTAFNRFIYRWSKSQSRFLQSWFTYGYLISIWIFLPFAIWTLINSIFNHVNDNAPELKAVLPGVNVPISDFWVYFLAIAFSSMLHELGHALAAAHEDVQLISVGVYVFTIVPVAFVQLNTEHLNSLTLYKRLRIYSAGVWHNMATAFIALLIFFSAPTMFNLAYETGLGVRVVDFSEDSPLKDVRGLEKGDIITYVNTCEVKLQKDWAFCLYRAYERYGFCTSAEYISENDEIAMEIVKENDVVECCRKNDVFGYCFEYIEQKIDDSSALPGQYLCLKPRDLVNSSFKRCTEVDGYACPRNTHCVKPSLYDYTYLIVIERKDNNPVLFVGAPHDVHKTVFVDEFFPKSPVFSYFSPTLFLKTMRYTFIFSMGIAFINILPCYGTDGHHIARTLIQILAHYLKKNDNFVTIFTILITFIGTVVTVPTLLFLFYQAIFGGI